MNRPALHILLGLAALVATTIASALILNEEPLATALPTGIALLAGYGVAQVGTRRG